MNSGKRRIKKQPHIQGVLLHQTDVSKSRTWSMFFFGSVVVMVVFAAFYLYASNRIAVQGYAIRSVERDIAELKVANNQLRIQEAELKSFHQIEETSRRLNMFESVQVSYIEEVGPIALR